MIVHSITIHEPVIVATQQMRRLFRGPVGTEEHKRFIFNRAKESCKWEMNDIVFYKGAVYQVAHVEERFEHIGWDALKPLFVEIWDGSDEMSGYQIVHPSDIKRKKL
jgi:hypothetical protein